MRCFPIILHLTNLLKSSPKGEGFSIKTTNDFLFDPGTSGRNSFDGTLFNQKTGADTVVLIYSYTTRGNNSDILPFNISDDDIKSFYSPRTVTSIDRKPIGNSKISIMVSTKNNNGNFVDIFLFNVNTDIEAGIFTDINFPLSASQLTTVQNIYRSFNFISQ